MLLSVPFLKLPINRAIKLSSCHDDPASSSRVLQFKMRFRGATRVNQQSPNCIKASTGLYLSVYCMPNSTGNSCDIVNNLKYVSAQFKLFPRTDATI